MLSRFAVVLLSLGLTACDTFVFGNVSVSEEQHPLEQKKTPRSGAEIYYGTEEGQHRLRTDKHAQVHNPDPKGAFDNWYTCLVMFKEGHNHYGGKMHGNNVYLRGAWRQEQYAEVHNNALGKPEVVMDRNSIRSFWEEQRGIEGPDYFRLVGGASKMWGLCLYFYDKEGHLINDSILKHSDEYQIFYTISDLDEHHQPYAVHDVRYREGMVDTGRIAGVEAEAFKNSHTLLSRSALTPRVFNYVYRDTWTHSDMGDGVRDLFNIKLLPPLTRRDHYDATARDQDYVGLKGHFTFDTSDWSEGLDPRDWPLQLSENSWNRRYARSTYLLPKFCLAVRIMKCVKGKKAVVPNSTAKGGYVCAPYYQPHTDSEWTEIIRFNLPIKIVCSTFDSDPTNDDPFEPLYYHLGREIGLTPYEAFEAMRSSSGQGALGYDAWFL